MLVHIIPLIKTQASPSAQPKGLQSPFSSDSCCGLYLIQTPILILHVRLAASWRTGSGGQSASTLLITHGLVLRERL